jgi:translation elongation factor EF-1beta
MEMQRVYRDARQGKISTASGSRLAFMLTAIAKLIEGSDHEARMQQVEEQLRQIEQQQQVKKGGPWQQ